MGTTRKTKECTKCGKRKPVGEFYADKTKKDGKKSYCKECAKEIDRQRHDAKTTMKTAESENKGAKAPKPDISPKDAVRMLAAIAISKVVEVIADTFNLKAEIGIKLIENEPKRKNKKK